MDSSQKGTAGSKASEVFVTFGKTSIPFLYPGCTAEINMRKTGSSKTSYFTKIMVTEVHHKVDARGNYEGSFEAIAADSGFIPRPDFDLPLAESQIATVVSNTDPDNQGRVKVRFDWQRFETTEFVRVMAPDAGGSGKVGKNRGFMAVPEVGDQVMVNFQHNHPDRPFVMGGMFTGKVGGGGGEGNNVKSLSSKSGHTIELNDGGGITTRDRGGNSVVLSGDGDISTKVSNNQSNDIGNDSTTGVGNSHAINAATSHTINIGSKEGGGTNAVLKMDNGGNVSIKCDTEIKFETVSSSITLKTDGTIVLSGKIIGIGASEGIGIAAQQAVDISSPANHIGGGQTKIDGGDAFIN